MGLIRRLYELSNSDVAIAGGKGASLGEMTQAGFPVPPGFVVPAQTGLEIDSELEAEIMRASDELGVDLVAVRSSATVEDGVAASWAGELESFLNISRDKIVESIKLCLESIHAPRAREYAAKQKIVGNVPIVVVVQAMVQSEIAGVAFSVHPVTGNKAQLVIEAGWGLGEAVVSGAITPDMYAVNRADTSTVDVYISDQNKALGQDGWYEIMPEKIHQQKLNTTQITELSRLVMRLEDHYGHPADVEWAIQNGTLYIVQCRPITTL